MCLPEQVLVFGDCAVNPNPTAEQLADIAVQSADSARAFGVDPRVAMLSYSTGTSGGGEDVAKVKLATDLARTLRPDLLVDGPLQYDAAIVPEVGRQKAPTSPVAGQATVFVFPDLNTGNVTYKAVQRSANAVAIGPMLQGLAKPVNDLSRGCLVEDIVFTIALTAIQAQQRFITENKAIMITGGTSSAVAVALNKLAQREKVLFVCGISGSNDTTGKDCVRYGFRQNFYGETAANAIGPVLVKAYGKGKKAAFMTPDYTYGHTVTKSVDEYLSKNAGWTMVTNQISPLGTQDFSQYLTNIANSGAEFLVNVNWGRDAVLSIQQAKQFGILPKMTLVVPYQIPFLAKEAGPELMAGVYAATDFWWTLQDKYPLAKTFVQEFEKRFGAKPEWGANNAYMSFALWAEAVENAGTFYPPDVIKSFEAGRKIQSTVGEVYFRKEDHQLVRPVVIVRGKAPKQMRNKEDFWEVTEIVPGAPLMQKPDAFGCKLGDYT